MKRTFQSLSGLPSSPRLSEYTEMPSKARKNNHNVDWTSQNEDYADGESDQISLKKRHIAHNLDPARYAAQCRYEILLTIKSTRPILEYDGYLKHTVNVRLSDYQLLQGEHELNDVILDMLIRSVLAHGSAEWLGYSRLAPFHDSHAYAQAFEDSPDAVSEALVFPTSFFIQLKAKTRPESTQQSQFEKAHSIVSHYDRFVWRSSVILIPAQVDRRWVLLVVCNAGEAKSSQHVLPPRQFIEAGDRKPDNRRFCILSLDPEGRSQSKLRSLTREYLKYDYMRMTGNELEFVEDFEARVSLCFQNCGDHTLSM